MVKPVTTEAADGIELKTETLLAYELHLTSIDSAAEQVQERVQGANTASGYRTWILVAAVFVLAI